MLIRFILGICQFIVKYVKYNINIIDVNKVDGEKYACFRQESNSLYQVPHGGESKHRAE